MSPDRMLSRRAAEPVEIVSGRDKILSQDKCSGILLKSTEVKYFIIMKGAVVGQ